MPARGERCRTMASVCRPPAVPGPTATSRRTSSTAAPPTCSAPVRAMHPRRRAQVQQAQRGDPHQRKREIEVKLAQLEDDLEEKGVDAEEIAERLKEARVKFEREAEEERSRTESPPARRFATDRVDPTFRANPKPFADHALRFQPQGRRHAHRQAQSRRWSPSGGLRHHQGARRGEGGGSARSDLRAKIREQKRGPREECAKSARSAAKESARRRSVSA